VEVHPVKEDDININKRRKGSFDISRSRNAPASHQFRLSKRKAKTH